jgi:hypothetical protein
VNRSLLLPKAAAAARQRFAKPWNLRKPAPEALGLRGHGEMSGAKGDVPSFPDRVAKDIRKAFQAGNHGSEQAAERV